jgi:glycosyltransferase involved in cell wall biosynthesis
VTTKPKVLIVIATDAIGGPGKGVFQFLQYASREAFDYLLCNFELKNRPMGEFVREARASRLNLTLLKQRATIDPGLILRARRLVVENGINTVQTHGYKANALGFFLWLLFGVPWIAFAHGYTDDNWKMRVYNRFDRWVLRHAVRIVCVSDSVRDSLIRRGIDRKKMRLVYNAIELPAAKALEGGAKLKTTHGIAADRVVIGVVGRLNPEKGQMMFLRAMREVAVVCPEAMALIVGDGQDRELLERYSREHELEDRVIFTGYRHNVADYYRILDLLVLPSLSEGLPNTVLEAMACGVPVLATRVGGVPEIIDESNGVTVAPNDPTALAEQMVELLRDDARRRTIGVNGRNSLYPRFAPDRRAREILDLYHEVLDTTRRKARTESAWLT